ncbi:Protein SRT-28 a [Aphelenchoides avenae]|nr:Protein SRT-28 a [Aphelenchus avenae]
MNVYLFQPDVYESLYNCSFYDINEASLEKRQHVILGYVFTIVFASRPDLIYVLGSLGLGLWIAESTVAILLAVSRCLEMWSPAWARTVFARKYASLWLIAPSVLALYFAFFTKPILFSGIYASWFFNPHVGYADGGDRYESIWHTVHNYGLLCSLVGIYVMYILVFY